MASDTVWIPGRNGSPAARAAVTSAGVQPGLTAKRRSGRECLLELGRGLSTVPAPTTASGTSRGDGRQGLQGRRGAEA